MSENPHLRLLASAGTGKTYRLAGHFLRLLLLGEAPERVLATTFTRKAAGEILDRVLSRLLDAAADSAGADSTGELARLAPLAPGGRLTSEQALDVLVNLVRRIDRFQVRTLDSFFVHVARLFALDLELPPDWTLVEERDDFELRSEALGRVLASLEAEPRLELMRSLQRESASRSVHRTVLRVVQEWREVSLDSAPRAWDGLPAPEGPTEEDARALALRLEKIEPPKTQKGTPVLHWKRNLEQANACVAGQDWKALLGLGLCKKILDGEEVFAGKAIDEESREVFDGLARRAAQLLFEQIASQTRAIHELLELFEDHYSELKRRRASYRFADPPRLLAAGPDSGRSAFDERQLDMWFRLDGRIDHLLLDEFQDTAPAQWQALEPLAEQLLAEGSGKRSFFCVGDVKQSIYGWREAEPRLLEQLGRRYSVLAEAERLHASWRSSAVVLDTVGRVFGRLTSLETLSDEKRPALASAAQRWQARFDAHVAQRELPGDARLIEARRRHEDEKDGDALVHEAVQRVRWLHERHPTASIGVLVRSNALIDRLLFELRQVEVHASGEGGNVLTDAESVEIFLSALQLADHPHDLAAAFHVARSPLAAAFGLEQEAKAAEASRRLRARLVHEGYGALAASILRAVEAAVAARQWGEWDAGRFAHLVDLAQSWDERATLRPAEFARRVRETRIEDPSASPVRVMTVHKSKGLEFDAVVLPETTARLLPVRPRAVLAARPDPFEAVTIVSTRPAADLLTLSSAHAELAQSVDERDIEEALCVLYVAMTRAKRKLEMILPPAPAKEGRMSTARDYAHLLREALCQGEGHSPDPSGVLWRHPESRDDWDAGLQASTPFEAPVAEPEFRLAATSGARSLEHRSASAPQKRPLAAAELLAPGPTEAARRGILVHHLMEQVEWIENFECSDEDWIALGAALEPNEELRREAVALLREALEKPELRALLSRPPCAEVTVHNERPFSLQLPDEDGVEAIWSGRIDRLVVHRSGGRPTAAEVIDFKTDQVDGARLEARVEEHRPQLTAYRRIAATLFGLAESEVSTKLAFLTSGRVVPLT